MVLPFHIVTRLDDAFHGQAEVKRAIGIAIAAGINNTGVTPRLLICGPSGTGKTSMAVSMAGDFLQPVVVAPITAYTQTDYGDDWQGTRCARCRMGGCPRAR